MSSINPNNIDGQYPVAGQDNNSQGFRDNFTNIKNNFTFAKGEIEDLQNKVLVTSALEGLPLNNELNNNPLKGAQLIRATESIKEIGVSGSALTINWAEGHFQSFELTAPNCNITFSGFPTSAVHTKLRLLVNVTGAPTNNRITFVGPSGPYVGLENVTGGNATAGTITFPRNGLYTFEITDVGTNASLIYINEVSQQPVRPRILKYQYFANVANAAVLTIDSSVHSVIIEPIAPIAPNVAIATANIVMPANNTILDGHALQLSFAGNITSVTHFTGNAGIVSPVTSTITGDSALYVYNSSANRWYRTGGSSVVDIVRHSVGIKNRIINGKMDISQRGTTFTSPATGAYALDKWRHDYTTSSAVTITQQADVPANNEFQNSLRVAVTTADTSIAAGDNALVTTRIEGFNVRDLIGRTFTLSFWVRSAKTGIHCVAFRNSGFDRAWIAEYSVIAANTWEFKTVTVPGGLITAGTWNWTTGIGLDVSWVLAAGTTFHSNVGAWQTGNVISTSSQVNCLDLNGNIFSITGVQLELGAFATPFEHRSFGAELSLAQRYYFRVGPGLANGTTWPTTSGSANSATTALITLPFPVTMRIAPTALEQSGTAAHYAIRYGGTQADCSAVPTFSEASQYGATFTMTVASGLTTGHAAHARTGSSSGTNAFFGWNVDL